jgi:hypothetical protein
LGVITERVVGELGRLLKIGTKSPLRGKAFGMFDESLELDECKVFTDRAEIQGVVSFTRFTAFFHSPFRSFKSISLITSWRNW